MTEKLAVPLLLLAIGALLGGVINAMIGRYAAFKEAQGIAAALRSEIESLLEMVKIRNYLPELDSVVTRLRTDGYQPTLRDIYGVKVTQDYFTVFHSLSGKLGLLGELSIPIVRLYVLGKGLVEDLVQLCEVEEAVQRGQMGLDREGLLVFTKEIQELFQRIEKDGPIVIARLNDFRSRRWLRIIP